MTPIVYAIPFFLALIGLEHFVAWRLGRKVYRTQDTVASLSIGMMSQSVLALGKAATVGIYALLLEKFATFSFDSGNPLLWLGALVLYDFCYYWNHRAGHEVNLLWAAHVAHHNSEEYNLSTALRQSSTSFLYSWIFYLPMALLGIPLKVFVAAGLIDLLYQFWVHTQLVPKLGWWDRVFVMPSNHRVHHGQNDYCIDRNYGGIWIVWDRLFGTYAEERDDEPVVYGVRKPLASWNPIWSNLQTYAGIAACVLSTRSWKHKLMRVFAGPGWEPPGTPAAPAFQAAAFVRYDTPASRWLRLYGLLATTAAIAFMVHFLVVNPGLPTASRIAYAALMLVSLSCLGMVWSGKPWMFALEMLRAALVFGAILSGYWFVPVVPLAQAAAGLALAATLALLTLALADRALTEFSSAPL
jgi:alkylglycerol monooxygenase